MIGDECLSEHCEIYVLGVSNHRHELFGISTISDFLLLMSFPCGLMSTLKVLSMLLIGDWGIRPVIVMVVGHASLTKVWMWFEASTGIGER